MTIQVQGHVESMKTGHKNKIQLTIRLGGEGKPLVLSATKEELGGLYLPGTPLLVTVRPA